MIWQLTLLGIALGFNNGVASVALGTMNMRRGQQLRIALTFGLFEALMPVIGMELGYRIAQYAGGHARLIGISVLVLTGVYSLLKKSDGEDQPAGRLGAKALLLAVVLSLDNLSAGFGLGMFEIPVAMAAAVFGLVSVSMTLLGLEIGRLAGKKIPLSTDKLSGAILLLTAGLMAFQ